jgi:hypothetical protein
LIGLANFPWLTESCLPVTRIGYEANKALELCVAIIQQQLAGQTPEALTVLPALHAHEVGGEAAPSSTADESSTGARL